MLGRVEREEISLVTGAQLMKVSYRQAKRLKRRYLANGDAGLVHGLRGRPSNRGPDVARRDRVLSVYQAKYWDFGPTVAAQYLSTDDGETVGIETLRGWLIGAGLWKVRKRRGPIHHVWRQRRAHLGMLVQMDGSDHDWFEGRRARAVLMVMVDDATNRTFAQFFEGETTEAAFTMFRRYSERYGMPQALYVDRDSIYQTTRCATVDEQLAAAPALTQFGRAMGQLGVDLILAHSPQAKGRVERENGVLQDRLPKALRLRKIDDLVSANGFLDGEFLLDLNQRFQVPSHEPADLHRPVPAGADLDRVLSFQEERTVRPDWTVRWRNRWFQLLPGDQSRALVNSRVLVCEQIGGTILITHRGRDLNWEELPERPAPAPRITTPARPRRANRPPAADHPWRTRFLPDRASSPHPTAPSAAVVVETAVHVSQ